MASKAVGNKALAFVFFNKFLDICEAIEDPENATLDNSDLDGTDIPSLEEVSLPETPFLPEDKREQIRDWVLE